MVPARSSGHFNAWDAPLIFIDILTSYAQVELGEEQSFPVIATGSAFHYPDVFQSQLFLGDVGIGTGLLLR